MELFFSYGHDKHTPLVKRLRDDLKSSHKVWIDYEKLNYDNPDDLAMRTYHPDWRRSITEGIEGSEIVLSFASEHAFRDETAVCFDELKIAVFVKRAFVQTVLLESKAKNRVPASAAHRQYIYLNEWADAKTKDDKTLSEQADTKGKDAEKIYPSEGDPDYPDFMRWYEGKLEEIKAKLARPEVQCYHDELKKLYELLNPSIDTNVQDRLAKSAFVGRDWLSEKVQEWIAADKAKRERALLITGSPGMGKSAFVVNEFMRSPHVAAAVFCQFDDPDANNIDDIARSIAYQMAVRYDDFRERLLAVLEEEEEIRKRGNEPRGRVFDRYVFNIANQLIDGKREYFIILIDGLDEVKVVDDENPVAEALERELDSGRDFIRFIFTSRKNDHVLTPLERVPEIDLDAFPVEGIGDIKSYVVSEIERKSKSNPDIARKIEENPELPQKIIEASEGNFLYANYACSQIEELSMEGELPKGLNDFYRKAMKRVHDEVKQLRGERERIHGKDKFDPICGALGVIAASDGSVPEKTLRRSVGWNEDESRREYDAFVNCLSMYIVENQEAIGDEPTLSFFHKSFADWLVSRDGAKYSYDREYSKELLAKSCFEAYEECIEGGSFDDMNDYEMINLLPLLEENKKKFKSGYEKVRTNTDFFDALVDRIKSYKPMKAIQIGEKILDHFPDFDLPSKSDNESLREFALDARGLMRCRVCLLELITQKNRSLSRYESTVRYAEKYVEACEDLMKSFPSVDIIEEYDHAAMLWASMYGTTLEYPRDSTKLQSILLKKKNALCSIDADPSVEDCVDAKLLHVYDRLTNGVAGSSEDKLSYLKEWVALTENVIQRHISTRGDLLDLGELRDLSEAFVALAKVYANDEEDEEMQSAREALQHGASLLEGYFAAVQTDARGKDSNLSELRYRTLAPIYITKLSLSNEVADSQQANKIMDECFEFIDEVILNSDMDISEKAGEIYSLFSGYFIENGRKQGPNLHTVIQRIEKQFEALESEMDFGDYLKIHSPLPREELASLLFSADLYEDAIHMLEQARGHVSELRVEKGDSAKRMGVLSRLDELMVERATRSNHLDDAIKCAQRGLDEVREWANGSVVSMAEFISEQDSAEAGTLLENAYCRLISSLLKRGRELDRTVAIDVGVEQVELVECVSDQANNDHASARARWLSSAYGALSDCYAALDMFDAAIEASWKKAEVYMENRSSRSYLSCLSGLCELYAKAENWDEAYRVGQEQLDILNQKVQESGFVNRYKGWFLSCPIECAEYLLRSGREKDARSLLQKQKNENPMVFPAILQGPASEANRKRNIQNIQQAIDNGEFDDPEIGYKLIGLVSEWYEAEAPQSKKGNS